jgi:uncharacterized membrane protein YbhN (UPF0104 family)
MPTSRPTVNPLTRLTPARRRLLIVSIFLMFALLYAVIPQLSIFGQARGVLTNTGWDYVMVATAFFGGSLLAAVGVYRALVGPKVRLWPAFVVQVAGSFAGKIVPLGLGSISLSYLYLRRLKLTPGAAGSTVAANNLIGMLGHAGLLTLLLLFTPVGSSRLHLPTTRLVLVIVAVVLVCFTAVILSRRRRFRVVADFIAQLRRIAKRPRVLLMALACSLFITGCMAACLYFSARAAGVHITLAGALIVLSAGLLAQSATPTPGGLGGVEAGLTGALVVLDVPLDAAIATALLYRFVTYWLPLLVGGLALALAIKRRYVA